MNDSAPTVLAPESTANPTPPAASPDTVSSTIREFLDRDLSWLEFNRRVLHEALDPRTPLLDRLQYLGIFTSNLDEFWMKRVGMLKQQMRKKASRAINAESEPASRRYAAIRETVVPMLRQQADCFTKEIHPALAEQGIHLLEWTELTQEEVETANRYFRQNVFPVLTPQSVDPGHPFPFISNLSTSLAVAIAYPGTEERLFARVKVPELLPQWVQLESSNGAGTRRFARLMDIIRANLPQLFPGMSIQHVMPIRVTRSATINLEDELRDAGEDLLELVSEEVRQRRFQDAIRLEYIPCGDRWLLDLVVEQLDLTSDVVFEMPGELDFTDLKAVAGIPRPDLKFPPWSPTVLPHLASEKTDIFALIRTGDLLVHHPYESFDASVAQFIQAAVEDDHVVAIKMTVYRTSDDNPFVPLLIQAADRGKQVACLVELKARFDESRNIRWANALEDTGVHVVYGLVGVKTHSKIALVVRRDPDGLRSYCHIGTGNYNPQTAKLYTDLSLFTCKPVMTDDVVELFHFLTGRSLKRDYQKLMVAPLNMKERFLDMIEREGIAASEGRPHGIVAKMNSLEDRDIGRALYRASQAGAAIDLIVRGICCVRPQVPDLSPTLRVMSVIGRFLEHSRIFYFRNGAEDPLDGEFWIGSADWMTRNLEERIEVVAPVEERPLRERLWEILNIMLEDQRQAWDMQPDGTYLQRTPTSDPNTASNQGTHQILMDRVRQRSENVRKKTSSTLDPIRS